MNEISGSRNRAGEIARLHDEIGGHLRTSLAKAIRIGELLAQQKADLPHGAFTAWITENLPFTDRTARNYMTLYEHREGLKTETVSVLQEAYRLLRQRQLPAGAESALDEKAIGVRLTTAETGDLMRSEGEVELEERAEWAARATKSPTMAPTDADGVPIPEKLQPIFAVQAEFSTFANAVSRLKGELEAAVEATPDAWTALEPQKRIADLSSLRHQFVEARPYLVCPVCGGEDPQEACDMCNGREWLSRWRARTVAIDLRNPQRKAHGLELLTRTSQRAGEETIG